MNTGRADITMRFAAAAAAPTRAIDAPSSRLVFSSRASRPRRRAFTLPEVLATLVLVGIALPAVMTGVSLAMETANDARKREEAAGLAEQKLSELTEAASNGESDANSGDFGADHPGFSWTSSVDLADTDLDEIRVRVSWLSRGRNRGVELAGYAYVGTGPNPNGSVGTNASSPAPPSTPAGGAR